MTQDVYSQLSRRVTEAEHRSDLSVIRREMWRLSLPPRDAAGKPRRDAQGNVLPSPLTNEEFNTLATEEAQRRMAINEQVNRRNQTAYRRAPAPDFEYEPLTAATAQRLAGTQITSRCPRCKMQLVFDAEPREHETAAYLICPDECGYAGERIA